MTTRFALPAALLCLSLVSLGSCDYSPVDYTGKTCTGTCPEGYSCQAGVCVGTAAGRDAGPAGPSDAGVPADAGAPVDAGPADAGKPVDGGTAADAGGIDAGCTGPSCPCGTGPACASGQRCSAGECICDALSCTGCCSGASCVAAASQTTSSCGTGGAACASCSPTLSDGCGFAGCACGTSDACTAGQRCSGGQCVCDATSCPAGCCQGKVCTTRSLSACGPIGGACVDCGTSADLCSAAGVCECGLTAACPDGQRCSGGTCSCDATSCPDGCCLSGVCTALSAESCAAPGGTCSACDPVAADGCSATGACQCGTTGVPCAAGLACEAGACVCNVKVCPDGCCAGLQCVAGTANNRCGKNGEACVNCSSKTCTDQVCQ